MTRLLRQKEKDPEWRYPYASRLEIENLRVYFSHFATRPRSWKDQTDRDTRVLPHRRPGEQRDEFASVLPHLRPRVRAWFNMMVERVKRERGSITPGKIRSLRMNAANFGRQVLTGNRRANKSAYDRRKRKWLRYLSWKAAEERKELLARRGPNPSKVLEIA